MPEVSKAELKKNKMKQKYKKTKAQLKKNTNKQLHERN